MATVYLLDPSCALCRLVLPFLNTHVYCPTLKLLFLIHTTTNMASSYLRKGFRLLVFQFSQSPSHLCHRYMNRSWTPHCIVINYYRQHFNVLHFNLSCCFVTMVHCFVWCFKQRNTDRLTGK